MKTVADRYLNMASQSPVASDSSQHLCLSMYIKTTEKIKDFMTNSERHFTWVSEVLEIARKQVASQDIQLLPKTPSAKRARAARKKTSTDDETVQPKKKCKNGRQMSEANVKMESISESDLDLSQMSTRSTRSNRASRGAANRSTRSTRNSKKTDSDDTDSKEIILDISKNCARHAEEGKNKILKVKEEKMEYIAAVTKENTKDADKSVIVIEDESDIKTPKAPPKLVNEQTNSKGLKSTPKSLNSSLNLNNSRSSPKPIPGFRGLNVKGKAEAYNLLIKTAASHSDVENTPSPRKASKRLQGECTPKVTKDTPETPPTILKKSQAKITLSQSRLNLSPRVEISRLRNSPNTPRTIKASPRRSVRGLRKSLSQRRSSIQQRKSIGKQSRFVKKVAAQERESDVDTHSECEAGPSSDSSEGSGGKLPARTTRSKMRLPKEPPKMSDPSSDEDTPIAKTPEPPRRTRSKMKVNNPPPQLSCPESTEDDDVDCIDKTPKNKSDQDTSPSTLTPLRTTRSKMRKLQENNHESPMTQIKPALAGGKKHKRGSVDVSRGIVKSDISPPKRHCPDAECPATPGQNRDGQEGTARSVLNGIRLKAQPKNLNTVVTSFIKRNTPVKMTVKDKLEQRQKDLEAKGKKDEDRLKKRTELIAKRAEEQKRRREEKEIRFAKRREENLKKEREQRKEMAQKLEESKNASVKLLSEKIKEEQEKQKLKERKIQEAETRRKNEEEARKKRLQELEEEEKRHAAMLLKKKEQDEVERHRKLEEQKRQQEKIKAEQERERLREEEKKRQLEEQLRKEEEEHQRRQERERKERAERERLELVRQKEREKQQREAVEKEKAEELRKVREQKAADKLKQEEEKLAKEEARKVQKTIENHNKALQQSSTMNKSNSKNNLNTTETKPAPKDKILNTTVTKEDKHESYEITPRKIYTASSEENYGIDDIHSDDSTDEEDAPRKIIPKWATGSLLKAALINQHYHPPNLDDIFDTIAPPDLNQLFIKKRPRFNKRTSSAVWDSPIMKPSVMHR